MNKRFVVCLGLGTTDAYHDSFRVFLQSSYPNAGWWHRAPDTWLIMDLSGAGLTAEILRNAVLVSFPGVHCLVLEFRKDGTSTWAGFGPNSGLLDWFAWIRNEWTEKF